MKFWKKLVAALVVLTVMMIAGIFAIDFRPNDNRVVLHARQPFSTGPYLAYVQPWGAEGGLFSFWSNRADSIRIDPRNFPAHTRFSWRWPPFAPRSGLSIWGYDHVAYGYYDGGEVESPIKPVRIRNIQAFNQEFAWEGSLSTGSANVLTEFYVRSNPADPESKTLEVGWLLHAPQRTHRFVDAGRQLGIYKDAEGRQWQAAINEKYLTFVPTGEASLKSGKIDMKHALDWLAAQKLVSGDEWVTGLGFGVEPMKGFGSLELSNWKAELR